MREWEKGVSTLSVNVLDAAQLPFSLPSWNMSCNIALKKNYI